MPNQNNKYNLVLLTDHEEVSFNKYDTSKETPDGVLGFDKLDCDDTNIKNLNIGKLYFNGKENGEEQSLALDQIINKDNLEKLTKQFNKQDVTDSNPDSKFTYEFNRKVKKENFYDILRYLNIELERQPYIKENISNFEDLYDSDFCSGIYRAAKNYKIPNENIVNNICQTVYPVISIETTDESLTVDLIIRNIPIPYKKFISSNSGEKYSMIFLYPEYLIKEYDIYDKGYMKFNTTASYTVYTNSADNPKITPNNNADRTTYANLQRYNFNTSTNQNN